MFLLTLTLNSCTKLSLNNLTQKDGAFGDYTSHGGYILMNGIDSLTKGIFPSSRYVWMQWEGDIFEEESKRAPNEH